MKQQAQEDQTATLRFRPTVDGHRIVPSPSASSKVTLKKSDGTTDLDGSAVVDATATQGPDGELSYALTAAQNANVTENMVADWVFEYNSVTYRRRDLWDIVKSPLYSVLTDDDIRRELGDLALFFYRDPSRSFNAEIGLAFDEVYQRIEANGRRPWLVIEAAQLRDAHAAKTLSRIFSNQAALAGTGENIWWLRHKAQNSRYDALMAGLPLRYDEDESGTIDPSEQRSSFSTGRILRA